MGECGFLVSAASCNWERAREYYRAGRDRDIRALASMQTELLSLVRDLLDLVGAKAHMDGACDKLFLKLALAPGGGS